MYYWVYKLTKRKNFDIIILTEKKEFYKYVKDI